MRNAPQPPGHPIDATNSDGGMQRMQALVNCVAWLRPALPSTAPHALEMHSNVHECQARERSPPSRREPATHVRTPRTRSHPIVGHAHVGDHPLCMCRTYHTYMNESRLQRQANRTSSASSSAGCLDACSSSTPSVVFNHHTAKPTFTTIPIAQHRRKGIQDVQERGPARKLPSGELGDVP